MTLSRTKKFVVAAAVLLAGGLAAPLAAQQAAPPAAALRAAAVWFGPLPTPSLFSPNVMERIEQLAQDDHWPMPSEIKPWPLDEHGKPMVSTRQTDELWHLVDGRRNKHRIREMYSGSLSRIEALNLGVDLNDF